MIKFHADEHIKNAVIVALRKHGVDISTAIDAGLLGASDLAHLEFANKENRVIVTSDDDFLVIDQTFDHCGVVFIHPSVRNVSYIINELLLMHGAMSAEEFTNHIEYR